MGWCRSSRGAARSGSSNARGNSNSGRWSSSGGAPLCPNHGLECLSLTANTANNPGRRFFKCPHQTEADSCLKFAWADEYEGGSGGAFHLACLCRQLCTQHWCILVHHTNSAQSSWIVPVITAPRPAISVKSVIFLRPCLWCSGQQYMTSCTWVTVAFHTGITTNS